MSECYRVEGFDFTPAIGVEDVEYHPQIRLAYFDDDKVIIGIGDLGCELSVYLSRNDARKLVSSLAVQVGYSLVDLDELTKQEADSE